MGMNKNMSDQAVAENVDESAHKTIASKDDSINKKTKRKMCDQVKELRQLNNLSGGAENNSIALKKGNNKKIKKRESDNIMDKKETMVIKKLKKRVQVKQN